MKNKENFNFKKAAKKAARKAARKAKEAAKEAAKNKVIQESVKKTIEAEQIAAKNKIVQETIKQSKDIALKVAKNSVTIAKETKKAGELTAKTAVDAANTVKNTAVNLGNDISKIIKDLTNNPLKELGIDKLSNEIKKIVNEIKQIEKLLELFKELEDKLNFINPKNIMKILNIIINKIKKKISIIVIIFINLFFTIFKLMGIILTESKLIYLFYTFVGYIIITTLFSLKPFISLFIPIPSSYINLIIISFTAYIYYNAHSLLNTLIIFLYDIISQINIDKILMKLISENVKEIAELFNKIFDQLKF